MNRLSGTRKSEFGVLIMYKSCLGMLVAQHLGFGAHEQLQILYRREGASGPWGAEFW